MKKLERKYKFLLLLPVLGAALSLGIVYFTRNNYNNLNMKIFHGYLFLFAFLALVSFGITFLVLTVIGQTDPKIAMVVMWIITWVLLDIAFINLHNEYLT